MGFALPLLFAGGVGLSAWSMYQQGRYAAADAKSQANLAEYNAQLAEREAQAAEAKTRFDQLRQQKMGAALQGQLTAKLGASGAVMDVGAPLTLLAEQAGELALENMLIGVEGRTTAERYRSQGAIDTMQAGIYRTRAKNARTTGTLGAAGTLLQGFGAMGSMGMFGGGGGGAAAGTFSGTPSGPMMA